MSELVFDTERVVCRVSDLDEFGSRAFTIGAGVWPLRGFVVRDRNEVKGYVNCCPHSRYPLNLRQHEFLTPDRALILCRFHGALFERLTGFCVVGPCAGQSLRPVPVQIVGGFVMLADGVDADALAADAP